MNKNELVLERIRAVVATDLTTKEMLFRLTSIEEPSLSCSAEGEEVKDAIGSLITTIYKAKNAKFSGSNSLFSTDLLASQLGTKKVIGSSENKIITPTYEILKAEGGKLTLKYKPQNDIKFIYQMEGKEAVKKFEVSGTGSATADKFSVDKNQKKISLPTNTQTGRFYVEYDYETENGMKISNRASEIPDACGLKIFGIFKDVCNENLKYSGVVVCEKAKLNPEQIEIALTSQGKHPFEFKMMKDYCEEENDNLFDIIVAE